MRHSTTTLALAPALAMALIALSACGSGGGGSGSTGGGGGAPAPVALGTREVPGYRISAHRHAGAMTPGATITVEASVAPTEGGPGAQAITALLAPEADWPQATAGQVLGDGRFAWTATVPADPSSMRLWVRITDPDGNVMETGISDFALQ